MMRLEAFSFAKWIAIRNWKFFLVVKPVEKSIGRKCCNNNTFFDWFYWISIFLLRGIGKKIWIWNWHQKRFFHARRPGRRKYVTNLLRLIKCKAQVASKNEWIKIYSHRDLKSICILIVAFFGLSLHILVISVCFFLQ